MDLHKKGVFNMPVSEIQRPSQDYDGHVDLKKFWDAVAVEMLSRGFIPYGKKNPFVVPLSYNNWAPWIGPQTRHSHLILNTEFENIPTTTMSDDSEYLEVTEERLSDEIIDLKVEESLRSWGASGGWAVITCPCGVVYSVKCNLRAESPRDYVDLLLSWKHFPNVTVYDYSRGVAVHGDRRQPETFHPFQGRLMEPTPENMKQASEGKLHVNMPWLKHPKVPTDENGHPLTGSSEHYALSDVFHQGNSNDERDVLRRIELVPELAGRIHSQCAEQLFSGMRKKQLLFEHDNTLNTHISAKKYYSTTM
ncbi:hypothetical protein KUCAC02_008654 [Chaenocephalus aceratus]|uniref:Uncharacterized protein n=1 Tax=Chaenocephalus aceratus TaxID=36190 RepID=A0ACB9WR76_CHAAC|nr:hypothetical protein KUCAC02_008654 [Chaenocephalus aceratus]